MDIQTIFLLICAGGLLLLLGAATHFSGQGSLDNIKSRTVGDGQHGTARWATQKEIRKTYRHIPFRRLFSEKRHVGTSNPQSSYCPKGG